MNKFMKMGAMMLLTAGCTMGVVSCTQDGLGYEPLAPVVTAAPNTLSGTVKTVSGAPVANAQVMLTGADQLTVMTNAQGVYVVSDLKAGTYQIEASATGLLAQRTEMTVAAGTQGAAFVWDAMLYAEKKAEVVVSETHTVEATVKAEALPQNTKAEVKMDVTVPDAAVAVPQGVNPQEVKVVISPLYSSNDAVAHLKRAASESVLMTGANVSCTKGGVKLTKKVDVTFELDAELAKAVKAMKFVNGAWTAVTARVEGNLVVVEADEFADYGLFLGLNFAERATGKQPIKLGQYVWDNLHGSSSINVENIAYSYNSGAKFASLVGANVLDALMIEKLAARYGAKVNTLDGSYAAKVYLPLGSKLEASAQQETFEASVSAMNHTVKATTFGKVTFNLVVTDREHTGGGSI